MTAVHQLANGTPVLLLAYRDQISDPVAATVLWRHPDPCDDCHMPAYCCRTEGGNEVCICASHIRLMN